MSRHGARRSGIQVEKAGASSAATPTAGSAANGTPAPPPEVAAVVPAPGISRLFWYAILVWAAAFILLIAYEVIVSIAVR